MDPGFRRAFYTTDLPLLAERAADAARAYRAQMDPTSDTLHVYDDHSIALMAIDRLEAVSEAIKEAVG